MLLPKCPICDVTRTAILKATVASNAKNTCQHCGSLSIERLTEKLLRSLNKLIDLSQLNALIFAIQERCPTYFFNKATTVSKRRFHSLPSALEDSIGVNHKPYDIVIIQQFLGYQEDDKAALKSLLPHIASDTIVIVVETEDRSQKETTKTDKWNLTWLYGNDLPERLNSVLQSQFVLRLKETERRPFYNALNFYIFSNRKEILASPYALTNETELYSFPDKQRDDTVTTPRLIQRIDRIFFTPDYRHRNPYQKLLYGDTVAACPGSLKDALRYQCALGDAGHTILHIHWIEDLFTALEDSSLNFEAQKAAFMADLSKFQKAGGKIVWTVHNLQPHNLQHENEYAQIFRILADQADSIILHAPFTKQSLAPSLQNNLEKIRHIPHGNYVGVYPSTTSRTENRTTLNIPSDAVVFLFMGQARPYKGLEELLDSFKKLQEEFPESWLIVAGKPTTKEYGTQLAEQASDIPQTLMVLDYISDHELQTYFTACDAVVLPFTNILNSGSAILALSFARPVIAPSLGNLDYLLSPCGKELLYSPHDSSGLLTRMQHVANMPKNNLDAAQINAYNRALDFLWNETQQQLNSLFTELMYSSLKHALPAKNGEAARSCYIRFPASPPKKQPRTAAIVCHYGRYDDTLECLLSLERQTGEQLDVYIVSNDDDPAAFGMFQHTFPHWTCIQSEGNVGFAAGNNQALALIRSKPYEYVWLVNPDVVTPPTYLRDLVEAADAHPNASIMGTYVYFEDKTLWFGGGQTSLENGFQATHQYYGAKAEQAPASPFECDYITGASLLFRNTLLENADYLPEELFLYFEETQWCMDAHRRGETILIFPTPSLIHKRRSTSNGVPALHYIYYYTRNLILTCQKYNSTKIKTCINTHKTTLALSWINKYERYAPEKLLDAKACLNEGIKDGLASVTGYKDINKFLLQHNAESKALSSIQTLK